MQQIEVQTEMSNQISRIAIWLFIGVESLSAEEKFANILAVMKMNTLLTCIKERNCVIQSCALPTVLAPNAFVDLRDIPSVRDAHLTL